MMRNRRAGEAERILKRHRLNESDDRDHVQHCPNPACPIMYSSLSYNGLRTHIGRSIACKVYEAAVQQPFGGNDNDDFDPGEDDLEEYPHGDEEQPPRQYDGPIPFLVREHERLYGDSRQSADVVNRVVNPAERSQAYVTIQKNVIKEVYGDDPDILEAFISGDMGKLLAAMARKKQNLKDISYRKLHAFMVKANLSDAMVEDLLQIITFFQANHEYQLPKTAEPINKFMQEKTDRSIPAAYRQTVQLPASWRSEAWPSQPDDSEVEMLDPVALYFINLLDPKGWGSPWSESMHFSAYQRVSPGKQSALKSPTSCLIPLACLRVASILPLRLQGGERVVDHFMSGTMAEAIAARRDHLALTDPASGFKSSDGIAALTNYNDAVAPYDTGQLSVEASMATYLNHSPDAQQKPWSKLFMGYVNKLLTGMTEDEVVNNLMTFGVGFGSQASAKRAIKHFCNSIYSRAHQHYKDCVNYAWHVGALGIIPGRGYMTMRFVFAALMADFPALMGTLSLKECKCHLCCYATGNSSDVYCPTIHCRRNYKLQYDMQRLVDERRHAEWSGEYNGWSAARKARAVAAGKFCQTWGLSEKGVPALLGTVIGASVDADFLNDVGMRDEFHDVYVGIFMTLIMIGMHTIEAFAKTRGGDIDVLAAVDEATSRKRVNRHPPKMRHLDHTTLGEGLVSQVLRTTTGKENRGTAGSISGMRSGWCVIFAIILLTAIGTGGDILPNEDVEYIEHVRAKPNRAAYTKRVRVKNPARLLCMALYAALDFSFELKRQQWTPTLVEGLKKKARTLQTLMTSVYHLMVAVSRKAKNEGDHMKMAIDMVKLHSISHYAERMMQLGRASQLNCATHETSHKENVSLLIRQTSQRKSTR